MPRAVADTFPRFAAAAADLYHDDLELGSNKIISEVPSVTFNLAF